MGPYGSLIPDKSLPRLLISFQHPKES